MQVGFSRRFSRCVFVSATRHGDRARGLALLLRLNVRYSLRCAEKITSGVLLNKINSRRDFASVEIVAFWFCVVFEGLLTSSHSGIIALMMMRQMRREVQRRLIRGSPLIRIHHLKAVRNSVNSSGAVQNALLITGIQ